jgi:hypothetical protein
LISTRWALVVEPGREIPRPFLYAIVFWLTVLFISFGLFSPQNAITIVSLFVCALSVCIALMLVVDMDEPFGGGLGFS